MVFLGHWYLGFKKKGLSRITNTKQKWIPPSPPVVVVGVEEWDDIIKAFPLRLAPPPPPVVVVGVREWDDIIKASLPLSIPLPPLWSNVVGDTTAQQRGVAAQF